MAAVHAALVTAWRRDRVVAARALFGSCFWIINDLLPRYGIEVALSTAPTLMAGKRLFPSDQGRVHRNASQSDVGNRRYRRYRRPEFTRLVEC